MALVEKAFGDIITFTRASGGGRINSLGQYEWVAANVPRLTHDPVTLQPLGLLIEEQRTNLLLRSTLEGGTAGTVGSGAVAPTGWSFGAPSPSGDVSYPATSFGTIGVRFQAAAQRPTIRQTLVVAASTTYCLSGRITELTGSLIIQDVVQFANVPAGAVTTFLKNGAVVANTSSVAAGDYVAAVLAVSTTAGNADARFGPGGLSNVTCGCTMTMPQVEQASAPSTYIPTEASQVTRAADVCSVNTLSPWYNATEGTLVVNAIRSSAQSSVRRMLASFSDTGINRLALRDSDAANPRVFAAVGSASAVVNLDSGASPLPGVPFKSALSWGAAGCALSAAGSTPVTNSTPSVVVTSSLAIGHGGAGISPFNGIISSISYYPRVIDVQQASA